MFEYQWVIFSFNSILDYILVETRKNNNELYYNPTFTSPCRINCNMANQPSRPAPSPVKGKEGREVRYRIKISPFYCRFFKASSLAFFFAKTACFSSSVGSGAAIVSCINTSSPLRLGSTITSFRII